DADYLPVDSAEFEVAIHKAAQVALVVTDPTDATSDHGDYSTQRSGMSSSGAVSFAVTSGTACSNAAGKLHVLTGTGTCKITATKAGDADYLAVDSAEFEVAIHKAAQVALVVTDPTDATFGHADYSVLTSGGSSSGAVSFAVTSGTACSNA